MARHALRRQQFIYKSVTDQTVQNQNLNAMKQQKNCVGMTVIKQQKNNALVE